MSVTALLVALSLASGPEAPEPGPAPAPSSPEPGRLHRFQAAIALEGIVPWGDAGGRAAYAAVGPQQGVDVSLAVRVGEQLHLGVQLGGGTGVGADPACRAVAACSSSWAQLGLIARWSLAPRGPYNPWLGVGLHLAAAGVEDAAGGTGALDLTGWEVSFSVGEDWRFPPFGMGVFATATLGRFEEVEATAPMTATVSPGGFRGWVGAGVRFVLFP